MADDPTIDYAAGTITLNFESDTNYTLSKAKITTIFDDDGLILIPQNYNVYESMDSTATWRINDMMVEGSTVNEYLDSGNSIVTSPLDGDSATRGNIAVNPTNGTRVIAVWYYEEGGASGGNCVLKTERVPGSPAALDLLNWGWNANGSFPSNYVYYIDVGSEVNSGTGRSAGWHKLILYTLKAATVDDETVVREIWNDGVREYTETTVSPGQKDVSAITQANPAVVTTSTNHGFTTGNNVTISSSNPGNYDDSSPITVLTATTFEMDDVDSSGYPAYVDSAVAEVDLPSSSFRGFGITIADAAVHDIHLDELVQGRSSDMYEQGSAQIDMQPAFVKEFTTFNHTSDTTGAYTGAVSFEASFSTDGGTNFGDNPPNYDDTDFITVVDPSDISQFQCDGDGNDVLRLKIIHDPDSTIPADASVPRTTQVVVNFAGYRYPFEYMNQ